MNEIEAQECYDAVGILLKHKEWMIDNDIGNHSAGYVYLGSLRDSIKKHLPCEHENYTILEEIYANHGSEVEIRIKCNNCDHLGLKVYNASEIISWDS